MVDVTKFRDSLSPKYHLVDAVDEVPTWASVTEPPADMNVDSDYAYDVLDAVNISTSQLSPETINAVITYVPPSIESMIGSLRAGFDSSSWSRVEDQLECKDNISGEQVKWAAQRVQSAAILADPEWADSYDDYRIDEQHHDIRFDDLNDEIDIIETTFQRTKEIANTIDHPPVKHSELIYDRFRLLIQLVYGEIGWEAWVERDPMVEIVGSPHSV